MILPWKTHYRILKKFCFFFKTYENPEHGWMWIGLPNSIIGGTKTKVKEKNSDVTPGIHNASVNSSYDTGK